MKNDFKIVIPARYASTRLPGKALLDIHGKPMIQHVYERAIEAGASDVVIATDSAEIYAVAESFAAPVCMTRADHVSGTERLAEVVEQYGWHDDVAVVNVQGDEPMIPPALIVQVARNLNDNPEASCASLMTEFRDRDMLADPNNVKVVVDARNFALYFSRAVIPYQRDAEQQETVSYFHHIGIYAYRAGMLRAYSGLPVSPLETIEKLEQLRLLWNGLKLHMAVAEVVPAHGIDTAEDLDKIRRMFSS